MAMACDVSAVLFSYILILPTNPETNQTNCQDKRWGAENLTEIYCIIRALKWSLLPAAKIVPRHFYFYFYFWDGEERVKKAVFREPINWSAHSLQHSRSLTFRYKFLVTNYRYELLEWFYISIVPRILSPLASSKPLIGNDLKAKKKKSPPNSLSKSRNTSYI